MSEAPTRLAKQSTYQRTLSRRGSRRPISRSSMDTLYVNIYNDVSSWSDMLRGIGGSCTPDRNDRGTARLESASARTAGVDRGGHGGSKGGPCETHTKRAAPGGPVLV